MIPKGRLEGVIRKIDGLVFPMLPVSLYCIHAMPSVPNVASAYRLSSSCTLCSQCCQCL